MGSWELDCGHRSFDASMSLPGLASGELTGPHRGRYCSRSIMWIHSVSLWACWVTFHSLIMEKEQSGTSSREHLVLTHPFPYGMPETSCCCSLSTAPLWSCPYMHAFSCQILGPLHWMDGFILPKAAASVSLSFRAGLQAAREMVFWVTTPLQRAWRWSWPDR